MRTTTYTTRITSLVGVAALCAGLAACTNGPGTADDAGQDPGASDSAAEAPSDDAPTTDQDASDGTAVADGDWAAGDTIPSGQSGVPPIQILEVHANGSGPVVGTGKRATLAYTAMEADGTVVDPGTRPFSFTVGAREAIQGWDVIVQRMRVGDSFTVIIPSALAYRRGDMKFDMELLSFQ